MDKEVIIIGGGISGLFVAKELKKRKVDFFLLEGSYKLGGRHLTITDEDEVLYEGGAWRVHSTHKRMLDLLKSYNLKTTFFEKSKELEKNEIGGISKFDENVLKTNGGVLDSLEKELQTGYQGIDLSVTKTLPYGVKKGEFFTIDEGQEKVTQLMGEEIGKKLIKLNHKVVDISKKKTGYSLKILVRKDNKIKEKVLTCKTLFIATPKHSFDNWNITKNFLLPNYHSVESQPLTHIYAKKKVDLNWKKDRIRPNSALQQTIKPTHSKDWFQISYSGGRVALFWNRILLKFGKEYVRKFLEKISKLKLEEIKIYHWTNAYHYWIPVPEFKLNKAVEFGVEPNKLKIPNLYIVGECFSSFQGWSEGALETSEMALCSFFEKKSFTTLYRKIPDKLNEWVLYQNFIIDVKKWKKVHPGSKKAIESHLKEDISFLFHFINHSSLSYAVLNSLKVGLLQN